MKQQQRIAAQWAAEDAANARRDAEFIAKSDWQNDVARIIDERLGRPGHPFVQHYRNGPSGSECFKMAEVFDRSKQYFEVIPFREGWVFAYNDILIGTESECRAAVMAFYGVLEIPEDWEFGAVQFQTRSARLSQATGFVPE